MHISFLSAAKGAHEKGTERMKKYGAAHGGPSCPTRFNRLQNFKESRPSKKLYGFARGVVAGVISISSFRDRGGIILSLLYVFNLKRIDETL